MSSSARPIGLPDRIERHNVATTLNNLADVLNIEGHYDEARELSQRALAIMEEALRPKHPEVAAMLYCLLPDRWIGPKALDCPVRLIGH